MGKAKALRHHYTWREHCKNALVTLISVLVLVLFVYPLVYTVLNSLKTYDDFVSNPQYALPKLLTWENYEKVFRSNFLRYFLNSVAIAALVVVFTVVFSAMAAFAIAKLRFRGQKAMEVFFLLGLMIPYQVVLIPLYITYSKIGLLDTYWALVLPQVAFGMPFSVQLFLAFFADCIIQNRYTAKITSRITPSTRPNDIPRYPITTSRPAQRIENGNSFINVFFSMVSGVNSAQAPQTTIRLKIFDPATLLTASVLFPAMDAVTLTASSGKLVPIATIVIPMIKDGTLNFFATEELPSTK